MEKDQNINTENQDKEPNEISPEDKDIGGEKNISENIDEVKEVSPEEKILELSDKLTRAFAEMENQRRRFEKEIKDAFEFGSFNFAKESLSILDNLQRAKLAIKNDEKLKENKDLDKFIENITIIEKDLINIFEKNRIKKIKTKNQIFNPNFHQAMSEIEDDKMETGSILQEIQAGYMLGERLLRPSLVGVAKKKTANKEEKEEKKEEK